VVSGKNDADAMVEKIAAANREVRESRGERQEWESADGDRDFARDIYKGVELLHGRFNDTKLSSKKLSVKERLTGGVELKESRPDNRQVIDGDSAEIAVQLRELMENASPTALVEINENLSRAADGSWLVLRNGLAAGAFSREATFEVSSKTKAAVESLLLTQAMTGSRGMERGEFQSNESQEYSKRSLKDLREKDLADLSMSNLGDVVVLGKGESVLVDSQFKEAVNKRILRIMAPYRKNARDLIKDIYGKVKGAEQERLIKDLLIANFQSSKKSNPGVWGLSANPNAGKSTAAVFTQYSLMKSGFYGDKVSRIVIAERDRRGADDVNSQIAEALDTRLVSEKISDAVDAASRKAVAESNSSKAQRLSEIKNDFLRFDPKTSEMSISDIKNKKVVILTEHDLEFLIGLRENSASKDSYNDKVLEVLMKNSVLMNTDYLDNASLQISDRGFDKMADSEFNRQLELVKEANSILRDLMGDDFSLKSKEGGYEIKRTVTKEGQEIVDANANDSLVEAFLRRFSEAHPELAGERLEKLRESVEGEEAIAAFKAAMVSRADIVGPDKFLKVTPDGRVVLVPVKNAHGRVDDLRVANSYQAIADALMHNAKVRSSGSNHEKYREMVKELINGSSSKAVEKNGEIRLNPDSVEIQGSGHTTVSFSKMLDIANRMGVSSTFLFVGAMTEAQRQTMRTAVGINLVSESKLPSLKTAEDVKLNIESFDMASNIDLFTRINALALEKGKSSIIVVDTERDGKNSNYVDKVNDFLETNKDKTCFVLDPEGRWLRYEAGSREKSETTRDATISFIEKGGKANVFISRPNTFGIDISGVSANSMLVALADSKSDILPIYQGLRRLRPEVGKNFSSVERSLFVRDTNTADRERLEELFSENQRKTDVQDRFEKLMDLERDSKYKVLDLIAEALPEARETISKIKHNEKTSDARREMQNIRGDTELAVDHLIAEREHGMRFLRDNIGKGDLKGFYAKLGKNSQIKLIIDTLVFEKAFLSGKKSKAQQEILNHYAEEAAYRQLTPQQVSDVFSKSFNFEKGDYPKLAQSNIEKGYTVRMERRGDPKAVAQEDLGPVSFKDFSDAYPSLAERIDSLPASQRSRFVQNGYMLGSGILNLSMQEIQHLDSFERESLNTLLDNIGLAQHNLSLDGNLISEEDSFNLIHDLVLEGYLDLSNPYQGVNSLLNAAAIIGMPNLSNKLDFNSDRPLLANELFRLQSGMDDQLGFIIKHLKTENTALKRSLERFNSKGQGNLYKDTRTVGDLQRIANSISSSEVELSLFDVLPLVYNISPRQINAYRHLDLSSVASEVHKLSILDFVFILQDPLSRAGIFLNSSNSAQRETAGLVAGFMKRKGTIDKKRLDNIVNHPEEIAQTFGISDADINKLIGVIERLRSSSEDSSISYDMFAKEASLVFGENDIDSKLRRFGLLPELRHGLRFNDLENDLVNIRKASLGETIDINFDDLLSNLLPYEHEYLKMFDSDIALRLSNNGSQLFTQNQAIDYLQEVLNSNELLTDNEKAVIKKSKDALESMKSEGYESLYASFRALQPVLTKIGQKAFDERGKKSVRQDFGDNWNKGKEVLVKVGPSGFLRGPDKDVTTSSQVYKPGEDSEFASESDYVIGADSVDNFMFKVDPSGKLNIRLSLTGEYNFGMGAHEIFHIAIENAGEEGAEATQRYRNLVEKLKNLKGGEFELDDFELKELKGNEALTRLLSLSALLSSLKDMDSESRDILLSSEALNNGGVTGHINNLLRTNQTVNRAVKEANALAESDDNLLQVIQEVMTEERGLVDLKEKAREERRHEILERLEKMKEELEANGLIEPSTESVESVEQANEVSGDMDIFLADLERRNVTEDTNLDLYAELKTLFDESRAKDIAIDGVRREKFMALLSDIPQEVLRDKVYNFDEVVYDKGTFELEVQNFLYNPDNGASSTAVADHDTLVNEYSEAYNALMAISGSARDKEDTIAPEMMAQAKERLDIAANALTNAGLSIPNISATGSNTGTGSGIGIFDGGNGNGGDAASSGVNNGGAEEKKRLELDESLLGSAIHASSVVVDGPLSLPERNPLTEHRPMIPPVSRPIQPPVPLSNTMPPVQKPVNSGFFQGLRDNVIAPASYIIGIGAVHAQEIDAVNIGASVNDTKNGEELYSVGNSNPPTMNGHLANSSMLNVEITSEVKDFDILSDKNVEKNSSFDKKATENTDSEDGEGASSGTVSESDDLAYAVVEDEAIVETASLTNSGLDLSAAASEAVYKSDLNIDGVIVATGNVESVAISNTIENDVSTIDEAVLDLENGNGEGALIENPVETVPYNRNGTGTNGDEPATGASNGSSSNGPDALANGNRINLPIIDGESLVKDIKSFIRDQNSSSSVNDRAPPIKGKFYSHSLTVILALGLFASFNPQISLPIYITTVLIMAAAVSVTSAKPVYYVASNSIDYASPTTPQSVEFATILNNNGAIVIPDDASPTPQSGITAPTNIKNNGTNVPFGASPTPSREERYQIIINNVITKKLGGILWVQDLISDTWLLMKKAAYLHQHAMEAARSIISTLMEKKLVSSRSKVLGQLQRVGQIMSSSVSSRQGIFQPLESTASSSVNLKTRDYKLSTKQRVRGWTYIDKDGLVSSSSLVNGENSGETIVDSFVKALLAKNHVAKLPFLNGWLANGDNRESISLFIRESIFNIHGVVIDMANVDVIEVFEINGGLSGSTRIVYGVRVIMDEEKVLTGKDMVYTFAIKMPKLLADTLTPEVEGLRAIRDEMQALGIPDVSKGGIKLVPRIGALRKMFLPEDISTDPLTVLMSEEYIAGEDFDELYPRLMDRAKESKYAQKAIFTVLVIYILLEGSIPTDYNQGNLRFAREINQFILVDDGSSHEKVNISTLISVLKDYIKMVSLRDGRLDWNILDSKIDSLLGFGTNEFKARVREYVSSFKKALGANKSKLLEGKDSSSAVNNNIGKNEVADRASSPTPRTVFATFIKLAKNILGIRFTRLPMAWFLVAMVAVSIPVNFYFHPVFLERIVNIDFYPAILSILVLLIAGYLAEMQEKDKLISKISEERDLDILTNLGNKRTFERDLKDDIRSAHRNG
ncbi:MAG: hypothetical protein WC214_03330, partial [Candidatus Omnitrophota bacterium]